MANKEFYFDIFKSPRLVPIIYGRVGDGDVQKIDVYLTGNDMPVNLNGCTIAFEGNSNGNTTVIMDTDGVSNIDAVNGKFTYTFPNMAFGVPGEYERAYFSLTNIATKQRSTTSDFKIIVFDNTDITAEEAETIITEYNKLIEKLNQAFKDAVAQMDKDYDQIEIRVNEINADLTALSKKIDQYNADVKKTADDAKAAIAKTGTDTTNAINKTANDATTKITNSVNDGVSKVEEARDIAITAVEEALKKLAESDTINRKELLKYLTGENIAVTENANFINKVSGSVVENPNILCSNIGTTFLTPEQFNYEVGDQSYKNASVRDDVVYVTQSNAKDNRRQVCLKFNVVEDIAKKYPNIFPFFNAISLEEKVTLARRLVEGTIHPVAYGAGAGFSDTSNAQVNGLNMQIWGGTSWLGGAINGSGAINKLEYVNQTGQRIQEDGFVYILLFAPPSNGTIYSRINLDCGFLEYKLNTNFFDMFTSKPAFMAHVTDKENPHSVTAEQAGALPVDGNASKVKTKVDFESVPTVNGVPIVAEDQIVQPLSAVSNIENVVTDKPVNGDIKIATNKGAGTYDITGPNIEVVNTTDYRIKKPGFYEIQYQINLSDAVFERGLQLNIDLYESNGTSLVKSRNIGAYWPPSLAGSNIKWLPTTGTTIIKIDNVGQIISLTKSSAVFTGGAIDVKSFTIKELGGSVYTQTGRDGAIFANFHNLENQLTTPITGLSQVLNIYDSTTVYETSGEGAIVPTIDRITFPNGGTFSINYETLLSDITTVGRWKDIALFHYHADGSQKRRYQGDRFRPKATGTFDWIPLNGSITLTFQPGESVRFENNGDITAGNHRMTNLYIVSVESKVIYMDNSPYYTRKPVELLGGKTLDTNNRSVVFPEDPSKFDHLRVMFNYQSTIYTFNIVPSITKTPRFTGINLYDAPGSAGYAMIEVAFNIEGKNLTYKYGKSITYTGTVTDDADGWSIRSIKGVYD